MMGSLKVCVKVERMAFSMENEKAEMQDIFQVAVLDDFLVFLMAEMKALVTAIQLASIQVDKKAEQWEY